MDAERYAERQIQAAIERGELTDVDGTGEPFGPMNDDPLWWVRSLLEREALPRQRQAVADRVAAAIQEAIRNPSLDEARMILNDANAVAVRWNDEHDERDHLETRSEIWLITERARRPA